MQVRDENFGDICERKARVDKYTVYEGSGKISSAGRSAGQVELTPHSDPRLHQSSLNPFPGVKEVDRTAQVQS
jgi:hypothetical protein